MITTLTKGLKGLLAVGLGAFMLALAPLHWPGDNADIDYPRRPAGPAGDDSVTTFAQKPRRHLSQNTAKLYAFAERAC